jgi:hypothetical protein
MSEDTLEKMLIRKWQSKLEESIKTWQNSLEKSIAEKDIIIYDLCRRIEMLEAANKQSIQTD